MENVKPEVQEYAQPSGEGTNHLRRGMSNKYMISMMVLGMLPFGPAQVYGQVALNSQGNQMLVYLLTPFLMLLMALTYKVWIKEFPYAGAAYSYVQRAINPHVGFVIGWMMMGEYAIVSPLLVSFSTTWSGQAFPALPAWLLIIVFTALNTFLVSRKIESLGKFNLISLIVQISLILVILVCDVYYIINHGGFGALTVKTLYNPDTVSWLLLASGCSSVALSFLGFETGANMTEESNASPNRVGWNIIAGLGLISLLFFTQALGASAVQPDYATLNPDTAYFDIIRQVGGDNFYYVILVACVFFVGVNNAVPIQTAASRLIWKMASNGAFWKLSPFLAKVNTKNGVPSNANYLLGLVTVVMSSLVILATLQGLVAASGLTVYAVVGISVPIYFFGLRKDRLSVTPFNLFRYGLLPLLAAAAMIFILAGFDKLTYQVTGIWALIGIIVGALVSKFYTKDTTIN